MFEILLLAAVRIKDMWYALPLVVAVSLVYSATRHEAMQPIVRHAMGCATWIVGFMLAVFLVLMLINQWL
jgi:hypothetical protein